MKTVYPLQTKFAGGIKIDHIFSNLEGGSEGPPLENFEYQESRRSHFWSFCKDNLTSVNEQYQRILLPFIVGSFKYKGDLDRYAPCLY